MQGITAMKVPEKYEPKNTDEFGTFVRAITRLLAVPADEMQRKTAKHKKRKKKSKTSESGPSSDSGGARVPILSQKLAVGFQLRRRVGFNILSFWLFRATRQVSGPDFSRAAKLARSEAERI